MDFNFEADTIEKAIRNEEDRFRGKLMKSRFAPPETNKDFDAVGWTMSALAVAEVVSSINRETDLKAWSDKKENYNPDIYLRYSSHTCHVEGYIELGKSNVRYGTVHLYERKLRSFGKWKKEFGEKRIVAWLDDEPNGVFYWYPVDNTLDMIGDSEPLQGNRGDGDNYWILPKERLKTSLSELQRYFTQEI
jgi:hypothetical protein